MIRPVCVMKLLDGSFSRLSNLGHVKCAYHMIRVIKYFHHINSKIFQR